MKTAVVILNYNTSKLLEHFLPLVIKYTQDAARIIVADNASTDDSVHVMQTKFSNTELIVNKVNGGFAAGYNECLRHVNAEYIMLLNSDVEVTENWLQPLESVLDLNAEVAAVQPKLRAFHNKSAFEFAGASGGFIDKFGFPFCRGRIFDTIEDDNGQYDNLTEVFWATGACMLIRKSVFDNLGGFDEDFFAHMEEIDLCWRIQNAGYKLMVQPASVVFHVGGGTLSALSARKTYFNFRNNLMMLHKNLPQSKLYSTLFLKMILDGLAAFKFLISNGTQHFLAVLNAHIYFYKHFKRRQIIRHQTQKKVKLNYTKNILNISIVWSYYVSKKKKFSEYFF